jgi:glycosyltransferase involved in cell wall biosynthesis
MARSFVKRGMDVTFIMPKAPKYAKSDFLNLLVADNLDYDVKVLESKVPFEVKAVDSLITAYSNETSYQQTYQTHEAISLSLKSQIKSSDSNEPSNFDLENQYGKDLYSEVWRYAQKVGAIAKQETFDVIHAHDWHTYQAGIEAKKVSGKPLVVHIHNTSYDRSGGNPNPSEYHIEYEGFHQSDKVIAISQFVKNTLVSQYGVASEKIDVVHNGIDVDQYTYQNYSNQINKKDKVVLFAGRVTLQKGPDYFIKAAHKVLQKIKMANLYLLETVIC